MATKKRGTVEEKHPVSSQDASSLKNAAEKKLARSLSVSSDMEGLPAEKLFHDLQVHQIELEMQADELRRTQLSLANSRDQYIDLYEFAPLGYLTLTDKVLISQTNLTFAALTGIERSKLINARFRTLIVPEDLESWDRYFTNLLQSDKKFTTSLRLKRVDKTTFPVRLEGIRFTDIGVTQTQDKTGRSLYLYYGIYYSWQNQFRSPQWIT